MNVLGVKSTLVFLAGLGRWGQEDQKSSSHVGYMANLRSSWAIWDKKKKEKVEKIFWGLER